MLSIHILAIVAGIGFGLFVLASVRSVGRAARNHNWQ